MKTYLSIMALALAFSSCSQSNAQVPDHIYYLDSSGKRLTPETALISTAQGSEVYKCQRVEAKISKSGTSISLRNVKKSDKK